jgi:hypothetical protein
MVLVLSYGGNNGERNRFGLEPMHITAKLTIFVGLSAHEEYLLSLLFFPTMPYFGETVRWTGRQGHLANIYVSENTLC